MKRSLTILVLSTGLLLSSPSARASEHELYYAQAGGMLNYAEAEVRILYAAVTQRIFDPTITRQSTEELERILTLAKRQVGRAGTLLPEKLSKHQDGIDAIKEKIIAAERQLEKCKEITYAAIEALTAEEVEEELDEEEGAPATDWSAIRTACAWVAQDIKAARTSYAAATKRLAIKPVRFPPPPSGSRGD